MDYFSYEINSLESLLIPKLRLLSLKKTNSHIKFKSADICV